MFKRLFWIVSCFILVGAIRAGEVPPSLTRLSWLAGSWQLAKDNRVVTEVWMAPEGKTMLGMSRTVVAGATREYEFLLLREQADGIAYIARPSGQSEATFLLRSLTEVEAVFEDPSHDFPQRIIYHLNPDGTLLAAIEGTVKGKLKRIEYPYRRLP